MSDQYETDFIDGSYRWQNENLSFSFVQTGSFTEYTSILETRIPYHIKGWDSGEGLVELSKNEDPTKFDQQDVVRWFLLAPSDLDNFKDGMGAGEDTINQSLLSNVKASNGENYRVSFSEVVDFTFEEKPHTTNRLEDADIEIMQGWSDEQQDGFYTNFGLSWEPPGAPSDLLIPGNGDVFLNRLNPLVTAEPIPGSRSFFTIIHELAHAIGGLRDIPLKNDDSGDPDIEIPELDDQKFTIMSKKSYFGTEAMGLQLLDIQAIQEKYNQRNYETRSDNTVYSMGQGLGFANTANPKVVLTTIWDGGGIDTIDITGFQSKGFSSEVRGGQVDLRQGRFSTIGMGKNGTIPFDGQPGARGPTDENGVIDAGNVAIAYHAIIENAIGTNNADSLIGNSWDNILAGRQGDDKLYGNGVVYDNSVGFQDINTLPNLDGLRPSYGPDGVAPGTNGESNNILLGGQGNDTFYVGAGDNLIHGGFVRERVNDFRTDWNDHGHFNALGNADTNDDGLGENLAISTDGADKLNYSRFDGAIIVEASYSAEDGWHGIVKKFIGGNTSGNPDFTDTFYSIESIAANSQYRETSDLQIIGSVPEGIVPIKLSNFKEILGDNEAQIVAFDRPEIDVVNLEGGEDTLVLSGSVSIGGTFAFLQGNSINIQSSETPVTTDSFAAINIENFAFESVAGSLKTGGYFQIQEMGSHFIDPSNNISSPLTLSYKNYDQKLTFGLIDLGNQLGIIEDESGNRDTFDTSTDLFGSPVSYITVIGSDNGDTYDANGHGSIRGTGFYAPVFTGAGDDIYFNSTQGQGTPILVDAINFVFGGGNDRVEGPDGSRPTVGLAGGRYIMPFGVEASDLTYEFINLTTQIETDPDTGEQSTRYRADALLTVNGLGTITFTSFVDYLQPVIQDPQNPPFGSVQFAPRIWLQEVDGWSEYDFATTIRDAILNYDNVSSALDSTIQVLQSGQRSPLYRNVFSNPGNEAHETYIGTFGDDNFDLSVFNGFNRVDTFDGNDTILGSDNDDIINAGAGNDILEGRGGNDILRGGAGDDTYIIASNTGNDIIEDTFGSNEIIFEGVSDLSELSFAKTGSDLLITIQAGKTLALRGYFDRPEAFANLKLNTNEEISTDALASSATIVESVGLIGTEQSDILIGESQSFIAGLAGNDILDAGSISALLKGGAGDDTYVWNVGDGIHTISDAEGVSVIQLLGGVVLADITSQRFGDNLNIQISGGGGLIIENYFGLEDQFPTLELDGGTVIALADVVANTLTGLDVTVSDGEFFSGTESDDTITLENGFTFVLANGGDDYVSSDANNNYIDGGDGFDTVDYSVGAGSSNLTIDTNYGAVIDESFGSSDTVLSIEKFITGGGNDTVFGSSSNEVFQLGAGENYVDAFGGDDTVIAGAEGGDSEGNDYMDGGSGIDTLDYSKYSVDPDLTINVEDEIASSTMYGWETVRNFEIFITGDGDDHITGGFADEIFETGQGADTVLAGDGDDLVIAGAEGGDTDTDAYHGGFGNDTLDYSKYSVDPDLTISASSGTVTSTLYGSDTISGFETFITGDGNDDVTGADIGETFITGGGNDLVFGNGGDDLFIDGLGNYNDQYVGGGGSDTVSYENTTQGIFADLSFGSITGMLDNSEVGSDTVSGIENVIGGSGRDGFFSNAQDNTFTGGLERDSYNMDLSDGSQDTIVDFNDFADGNLVFLNNFDGLENLRVTQDGDDLILSHIVTGGSIRFDNWMNSPTVQKIRYFENDGFVTLTAAETQQALSNNGIIVRNVAPDAFDDAVTVNSNSPTFLDVLTNDTDPEANTLFISNISAPINGSAFIAGGQILYVPNEGFVGSDSITYTVDDGFGGTDTGTVTITVQEASENTPPAAQGDAFTGAEDAAVTGNVLADNGNGADSDADGDTLTVTPATLTTAQGGSVELLANGDFTYTPATDFNGQDSFTYTVTDGNGGSDTATVTLDIAPVNDAPLAADDVFILDEDTVLSGNLLVDNGNGADTDVDGDILAVVAETITTAAGGTVDILANGDFTYTPAANFNGADSFSYTLDDGNGGTAVGNVSLTVNPVNDAPVANDDALVTDEDTAAVVNVLTNDSDADNDTLAISAVTNGANGTVTHDGTAVTYTPNANFFGEDSFTYTVSDGNGGFDTATVNVTVNPVNDNPITADDSFIADEDVALVGNLLADNGNGVDSDIDGDNLSVVAETVTTAAGGTVDILVNGDFTYTPAANFNGADSFNYTLYDGNGGTAVGNVSLTVNPINDAPMATDDTLVTDEDTAAIVNALGNDDDADNDTLAISDVTNGANGTVTHDGTSVTYTPDADFFGTDSFTYTVADGNGGFDTATVDVTVNPVNDNPVANDDTAVTDQDSAVVVDVLANDTDVENDALSVSGASNGSNGTVSFDGTSVTYTPNAGFSGTDSFTYTVSDGNGGFDTATVNVTVNATQTNTPPVANDDDFTVEHGNALTGNLLVDNGHGADSDADNDNLTVTAATIMTLAGASVTLLANGDFSYEGATGFVGTDSFEYTLEDGNGGFDTAFANITVTAPTGAVVGDSGDDTLNTGIGSDTIFAGEGNNTVATGSGSDTIYAGNGDDDLNAGSGDDIIFAGGGDNIVLSGSGDDMITSGDGDDVIEAGSGHDTISSGGGNDDINSGSGDDIIYAGAGNDVISAGSGDDFLDSGFGMDIMTGGSGADTFYFGSTDAVDTITDFSLFDDDILDITDLLTGFDPLADTLGDWANISESGSDSILSIDQDGLGAAFSMTQLVLLQSETGLGTVDDLLASGHLVIA